LNRSLDQDDLHWSGLNSLSQSEKDKIIRTFWQPHRQRVEQAILSLLKKGSVVHIGSHSFTPRLRGKVRSVDIGILFDPSSKKESKFAEHWIKNLKLEFPKLKIQKNSPYKGTSDGFTTSLRKLSKSYLGLELEINQRHLVNGQFPAKFRRHIIKSLPKT